MRVYDVILVGLALLTVPRVASPASPAGSSVAVFPVVARGKVDKATVTRVQTAIEKGLAARPGVQVVAGNRLKTLLKRKPSTALQRCGSDVACIAKLAKAAGSLEAVLSQVAPSGSSIQIGIIVVNATEATIRKHWQASVGNADEAVARITAEIEGLYPTPEAPPEGVASSESASPAVASAPGSTVDGAIPPAESPTSPNGPPPASALRPGDTEPAPSTDPAPPAGETSLALGAPPQRSPSALSAMPPPAVETHAPAQRSKLWRVAGIAFALAGAATLGTGAYFGISAQSDHASLRKPDDGTSQKAAIKRNNRANDYVDRANLFLGAGAGLAVVGSAILVIDMALRP